VPLTAIWSAAVFTICSPVSSMVISGLLTRGARYVVNTAFNGRGPQVRHGFHVWCNPRGRALGPLPTTQTHAPHADAFFWLGNPGVSDGHCNGGPQVGTFWTEWALELSANALSARDFPV
jgi:cellulase/cellobiase CelA1